MSVTSTLAMDIIPYTPNPPYDESKPIAHWRGAKVLNGDGTGGILQVTFQPAGTEGQKYLWSCEDFTIGTEGFPAATWVNWQFNTGEMTSSGSQLQFHWASPTGWIAGVAIAAQYYHHIPSRYIHQPKQPLTNSYIVTLLNGVGFIIYANAWGYLWLPQARRLAGGPSRPT